ncbi:MAG: EamA family transporter, partial [Casimicrobiaceae bacterium]
MSRLRIVTLTSIAMLAFAGNSLLCRIALMRSGIDAASFTAIRLIAGALMLLLVVRLRGTSMVGHGNWLSALTLFAYAASFSYAYVSLPAAPGALLLFGAVQVTMIGYGIRVGERLRKSQVFGLLLAFVGLVGLLLPGISAPPVLGSLLMLSAGTAWGVYSLRGKTAGDPTQVTAGN